MWTRLRRSVRLPKDNSKVERAAASVAGRDFIYPGNQRKAAHLGHLGTWAHCVAHGVFIFIIFISSILVTFMKLLDFIWVAVKGNLFLSVKSEETLYLQ